MMELLTNGTHGSLAEKLKTQLLQKQTTTAITEAIGDHTADAEAKKKGADIKGKAAVVTARLAAEAAKGRVEAELAIFRMQVRRTRARARARISDSACD